MNTHRQLVRITKVSGSFVDVVVPGWDPNKEVTLSRTEIPSGITIEEGKRLHARVNLNAEDEQDLGFCGWEST